MTKVEFQAKLIVAFDDHAVMRDKEYHTINELLYILEHDSRFKGMNFNISICTVGKYWTSIPSLDAFVPISIRSMWFRDVEVEFETEEVDGVEYSCITIREIRRN